MDGNFFVLWQRFYFLAEQLHTKYISCFTYHVIMQNYILFQKVLSSDLSASRD